MDTSQTQAGKRKCEEGQEMNFAAFATAAAPSTHFVTTGAIPVTKIQQNATQNGTMQQVVGMGMDLGNGMQFVQGGGAMQNTPQLITLPIALPGAKPGDPQQTVQIQVLSPNLTLQQQQPKYQMQIPIQGFSQGGAVLTLAYSPENNDGLQLLGPEGMQVLMPQDVQMLPQQQQDNKDNILLPQQVYIQNQQIVINGSDDKLSTNNNNNNNFEHIIIKEEYDDTTNDDESSQGTEGTNDGMWTSSNPDIASYINKLPQQTALPVSLQQFLKLNPAEKKPETVSPDNERAVHSEAIFLQEDGSIKIKKKKKYKKKPAKPARPKPGQVILATSSDGTTIFCCPECQMAFQEKEQLESHLSTHKIERRFICGICGAGLKRKEHLERHKLGHNPERPFVCGVCRKGFKRREHLNLHAVIHSGIKSEVCNECGKGFYRKDHLRKHTRSHDAKRARDAAMAVPAESMSSVLKEATGIVDVKPAGADNNIIMPEITIHVPTSANVQVPVQINIPQHVVTSLAAQQANSNSGNTQLEALLTHHT